LLRRVAVRRDKNDKNKVAQNLLFTYSATVVSKIANGEFKGIIATEHSARQANYYGITHLQRRATTFLSRFFTPYSPLQISIGWRSTL